MSKPHKVHQVQGCKICNGQYINSGSCPAYGLKFRGYICPQGKVMIYYKDEKIRNKVPWFKFWKSHYDIIQIVVAQKKL